MDAYSDLVSNWKQEFVLLYYFFLRFLLIVNHSNLANNITFLHKYRYCNKLKTQRLSIPTILFSILFRYQIIWINKYKLKPKFWLHMIFIKYFYYKNCVLNINTEKFNVLLVVRGNHLIETINSCFAKSNFDKSK